MGAPPCKYINIQKSESSRFGYELSRTAQLRLVWMSHYLRHGRKAAFTCRHFGISRQTFYRWWRRYDPHNLTSLEDRSHRPRRRRRRGPGPPRRVKPCWLCGASIPLGKGQTGRVAPPQESPALHLHGRPDPERSETSWRAGGNSLEGTNPSPQDARPSLGPAKAPFGPFDSRGIWSNSTPKRCDPRAEWC